jgi:hypothetical protein
MTTKQMFLEKMKSARKKATQNSNGAEWAVHVIDQAKNGSLSIREHRVVSVGPGGAVHHFDPAHKPADAEFTVLVLRHWDWLVDYVEFLESAAAHYQEENIRLQLQVAKMRE